jgi:hypothetical protein
MAKPVASRGPGKFRQLRDYRKRTPPSSAMTITYVEPDPPVDPKDAAELRARLAGLSDWDLRGLDVKSLLTRQLESDSPG